ncbi:MAG: thiamine-phosphate diphosphorylase [Zetaproteobacteria bacterium CG1_02_49_23]|nr:MAG: thiamine-phosphate diphosphorylase [Zetaproteobacteria bacterium CG1_02_49_23]
MTKRISGIYGILPSGLTTADLLHQAEQALQGGVRLLQFRDKDAGYKKALKRAKALRQLTLAYDARLVVNDSVQMAVESGADGVHLGRDDEISNMAGLRQQIGDSMLVGITCRADAVFARVMLQSGADYVSFGAVWASNSKPEVPEMGLPRLLKARQMFPEANICAIGGIDRQRLLQVKAAGVDCAAVIAALFAAPDIKAEAQAMVDLWNA